MEYGEKKIPGGVIVGMWEEPKPTSEAKVEEVKEAPKRRTKTKENN